MKVSTIHVSAQHRRRQMHCFRSGITRREVIALLVVLGVVGVMVALQYPTMRATQVPARRAACLANLNAIAYALQVYQTQNDNHWPYIEKLQSTSVHTPPWPTLANALKGYGDVAPEAFRCPADTRTLAGDSPLLAKFGKKTTWFETEGSSYEWMFSDAMGGRKVGEEAFGKAARVGKADLTLLRDFEAFHTGDDSGTFNTLNADLKVRTARVSRKRP